MMDRPYIFKSKISIFGLDFNVGHYYIIMEDQVDIVLTSHLALIILHRTKAAVSKMI